MGGEAEADQADGNPHHKGELSSIASCAPPALLRAFEHVGWQRLARSHAGHDKSRHRAGLVDGDGFSISRPCPKGQTDVPGKLTNGPLMAPRQSPSRGVRKEAGCEGWQST